MKTTRTRASPKKGVGPLYEGWKLIFQGRVPSWAKLDSEARKAINRGALAELGDRTLRLSRLQDVQSRLEWAQVWYTVVVSADKPIQTGLPLEYLYDLLDIIIDKSSKKIKNKNSIVENTKNSIIEKEDLGQSLSACEWVRTLGPNSLPKKEQLLHAFPRKSHPQAGRKANMFLDKMLVDLAAYDPAKVDTLRSIWSELTVGQITDDQACSSLLYGDCVAHLIGFGKGVRLALWATLNPDQASALSDILKTTGVNTTVEGAMFCELKSLLGRGVNPCDLLADARRRTVGALDLPLVYTDEEDLARAVDEILDEELDGRVALPTAAEFWCQRYRWCVGGSHNLATNAHWQMNNQYLRKAEHDLRWNRRAAAEVTQVNPLSEWSGRVEVSVAEKLEHAKGRAIYSCDTLSYYAFSWLLRSVEEKWKSRRVILDPGRDGHLGMFNRIAGMTRNIPCPVYTMLDFSDFNSQHTLASQKIVIERILARTEHTERDLADLLVRSLDNMYIRLGGKILGRVGGSLMSGHRGTTFLNSVLNAAYIRLALGRQKYYSVQSLHVGDDVLIISGDESFGWLVADKLVQLGCTLQTSKQSIGRHGFEFLRMAGNPLRGAQGYLARSVAGLVSGNWVTDFRAGPLAALHSLVQQARSIINRSKNSYAWRLMVSSASAITGLGEAELADFLSGAVAVAPGPCYRNDGRYCYRIVTEVGGERAKKKLNTRVAAYPRFASEDYIREGLHPLEREGLRLAGFVPWASMALSSFGTMELSRVGGLELLGDRPRLEASGQYIIFKAGVVTASQLTTTAQQHGFLAHYPVLSLLKNVLNDEQLRYLLEAQGVAYDRTCPYRAAWGGTNEGAVVSGAISYSDAAGSASRNMTATLRADVYINL